MPNRRRPTLSNLRAMTRISYTKSVSMLLKGADRLLIVATRAAFDDGGFLDLLPEELMRLALDLASDTQPGGRGAAAGTLTGIQPRKLAIGVLPDEEWAVILLTICEDEKLPSAQVVNDILRPYQIPSFVEAIQNGCGRKQTN